MRCPKCNESDIKVIDSRTVKDGNAIRRRRECSVCSYRFSTQEEILFEELKIIKKDGTREPFERDKIRQGINKACWKRPISSEDIETVSNKIVTNIESKYDKEISTLDIGKEVMCELRKVDEVAYVRFASVYRSFKDLNEFIDEIKTLAN